MFSGLSIVVWPLLSAFQVEERRTVRDGDGNETTTVTRKMGGKTETETTSRQSDGSEERQLGSFSFFGSDRSPRNEMLKPIPEQEQPSYKSIFSKIFGNWCKINSLTLSVIGLLETFGSWCNCLLLLLIMMSEIKFSIFESLFFSFSWFNLI